MKKQIFRFQNGNALSFTVEEGRLAVSVQWGSEVFNLFSRDIFAVKTDSSTKVRHGEVPVPETLSYGLLGNIVGLEETDECVLIHSLPVSLETGAVCQSVRVHYAFEKVREDGVRMSTWFNVEGSVTAEKLHWASFSTKKTSWDQLVGFDPEITFQISSLTHSVHVGQGALVNETGYLMLREPLINSRFRHHLSPIALFSCHSRVLG